ncbi:MAG: hypothetical protein MJ174_01320 [Treponema sp.]|nr:hypothetical protein [Treponema sp.]
MKNFNTKTVILIFLIFLCNLSLFAESPKFVQRLEWSESKNSVNYKVEIQSVENTIEPVFFVTKNTYIEFSLPSGFYKYRVYVYDFLGRERNVSSWHEFEIKKAVMPEVVSVQEKVEVSDDDNQISIPVNVKEVNSESKVVLVNTNTGEEIEGQLNIADEDSKKYSEAFIAHFPKVETGNWKLKITNPGGLTTESIQLEIANKIEKESEEPEKIAEVTEPEEEKSDDSEKIAEVTEPEENKTEEPEKIADVAEPEEEKSDDSEKIAEVTEPEEDKTEEPEKIVEITEPEEEKSDDSEKIAEVTESVEDKTEEPEKIADVAEPEEDKTEEPEKIVEVTEPEEEKSDDSEKIAEVTEPEEKKPYDPLGFSFNFGGAYSFLLPLQEISLADYADEPTYSLGFSFAYVPARNKKLDFGFELSAYVTNITTSTSSVFVFMPLSTIDLSLITKLQLVDDKLALNLKTGGGVTLLFTSYKNNLSTDPSVDKMYGYLNGMAGLSLSWTPSKFVQLETGANAYFDFITNKFTIAINPYMAIGVRF